MGALVTMRSLHQVCGNAESTNKTRIGFWPKDSPLGPLLRFRD